MPTGLHHATLVARRSGRGRACGRCRLRRDRAVRRLRPGSQPRRPLHLRRPPDRDLLGPRARGAGRRSRACSRSTSSSCRRSTRSRSRSGTTGSRSSSTSSRRSSSAPSRRGIAARRAEAEQREREAALLADMAADLLRGAGLEDGIGRIEERTAAVLGVSSVRIALGDHPRASAHESPHPLTVEGRTIGMLFTPENEEPALATKRRLLPALASLIGVAIERETLAREALEAETLRRSDTVKTAVIQAVSHDLRTPLATIEQALDGLESRRARADRRRSRRAARDDPRRAPQAEAARREPPRPLAAAGACGAGAARAVDGRRARRAGTRRARPTTGRVVVTAPTELPPCASTPRRSSGRS